MDRYVLAPPGALNEIPIGTSAMHSGIEAVSPFADTVKPDHQYSQIRLVGVIENFNP
jgi:hypothetical protein